MKFIMRGLIFSTIIIGLILLFIPMNVFADEIPQWIKTNAEWWSNGTIDDDTFVGGIEYLVNENIVIVSTVNSIGYDNSKEIPQWIKTNAEWWSNGTIDDDTFVGGIEYLIEIGIINIKSNSNCQTDLNKLSTNIKKIKEICNNFELNKNFELIPYDVEINYNDKGFRGQEFAKEKTEDEFRIIMVGGSTIIGTESSSIQTTIPVILQKIINHNNPELKIQIINAGLSGATSHTEFELIKNKLVKFEPNLIIVYDGWNDLSADYAYAEIKKNWESICKIGSENNFEVMIFLQPIAGFGNKVLTQQESVNSLTGEDHYGFQLIQIKSMYEYLSKISMSLENQYCHIIDFRDVFDDVSGPIYWDQGHILDTGNFIIADNILNELNKNYPKIFSYDNNFIKIISNYNHLSIAELLFSKFNIDVNYSNIHLQDETKLDGKKGDYFKLKHKFGIDEILVGKDLRNIDLESIELNGKDLTGANLSGQDLRNIDFTSTIIRDADLSYSNLEGKNFTNIDIRGIDFSFANLKGADFRDAKFSKLTQLPPDMICSDTEIAISVYLNDKCIQEIIENGAIITNFSNADLTNAKFGSLNTKPDWMNFIDFTNTDLTNVSFIRAQCAGCIFNGAILDNVKMDVFFVRFSSFNNIKMQNFEMNNTWIHSVSFENAEMLNGKITQSTLIDVNFINAKLDGTYIAKNNRLTAITYN